MPTPQQADPRADAEKLRHQELTAAIGQHVIRSLGQPVDFHQVHVRSLWKDHFRVNVVVGRDITSARIANSFFLVADGDGEIVKSTPRITKQY